MAIAIVHSPGVIVYNNNKKNLAFCDTDNIQQWSKDIFMKIDLLKLRQYLPNLKTVLQTTALTMWKNDKKQ